MNGRQVGVRIPENQSTEQAPVMTVVGVLPCQWVFVSYGDERGNKHDVLALVVDGKAYPAPNGDAWTAGFKPFTAKMNEQIMDKVTLLAQNSGNAKPFQPPALDTVDVLGGIGATSASLTDAQLEAVEKDLRKT